MNAVLIFAKSPILGFVKTRLCKKTPLSEEDILELYKAFLKDTIIAAEKSFADAILISCYPVNSLYLMEQIISEIGFSSMISSERLKLIPQEGASFDDRITTAGNFALHSYDSVVIIGTDSPTITPGIINGAIEKLKTFDNGMVLGPSGEGGVYLIGIKSTEKIDFRDVFGTGNEIDNLVFYAKANGWSLHLLEELTDVDLQPDLITIIGILNTLHYARLFQKDIYVPFHTSEALNELGLFVSRKDDETREKIVEKKRGCRFGC